MRSLILAGLLSLSVGPCALAMTPKEQVDRIEALWKKGDKSYSEVFRPEAGEIGEKEGRALIDEVLNRAATWESVEGLIYVPLIACLPREATLKWLKQYELKSDQQKALWAREFQIELESISMEEARKQFRVAKGKGRAKGDSQ